MAQRWTAPIYSAVKRVAASRLGARVFSRLLHHFDRIVLSVTGHRTSAATALSGLPLVVLTTRGARSGLARNTPLLPIRDKSEPGIVALVASNWGQGKRPAWYYNLKANPRASCSLHGMSAEYDVHEAFGKEYEKYWKCAVDTYHGYQLYKERLGDRHVPIMILSPVESQPESAQSN